MNKNIALDSHVEYVGVPMTSRDKIFIFLFRITRSLSDDKNPTLLPQLMTSEHERSTIIKAVDLNFVPAASIRQLMED